MLSVCICQLVMKLQLWLAEGYETFLVVVVEIPTWIVLLLMEKSEKGFTHTCSEL